MSLYLNEPSYPDFHALAGELSLKLADLRLPYDSNKWDDEIVDALHEQHPYLPKGQVKISLNIKDGKQGYAVGNISLDDRVQLPVIVDNFHLKPFDMFMKEGKLHAMTKESIMGALQHTEFGTTVSPGQGESSDVFMTHSRAPYDGKYTFASWTEGDPAKIEKALTNVFGPDGSEYFMGGDKRMHKILDAAMSGTKKYQHMRHDGHVYEPGGPLIRNTSAPVKKSARVIKGPEGDWSKEAGIVETTTPTGRKVAGMVFNRVYDLDHGAQDQTRFVAMDGSGYSDGAVFVTNQLKTAGDITKVAREALPHSTPNSGQTGMWMWAEGASVCCTEVVTVLDKTAADEVFRVKNAVRSEKTVAQHPLLEVAAPDKGVLYLPKHATFVGVTDKKLTFGPSSNVVSEEFFTVQERGGRYKIAFYISPEKRRKLGRTQYDDMSAPKVANLLGRFFESGSVDSVLYAAKRAGTGIKVAFGDVDLSSEIDQKALDGAVQKAVKTAQRFAPSILAAVLKNKAVDPTPLRKMAIEIAPIDWRAAELVKVATDYDEEDDAMTVDQALDLNILNPQNITKYVDGINLLERARQFILKLLLASRLGLGIDSDAARTAAFAMDEVIRDLQQLRSVTTAGE